MAEWSIATVLKTVVLKGTVGSNPTLSDKTQTALITGASSGIGLALAEIFAANGYHLVLVARTRDKLEEIARDLKQRFGISVKVMAHDLSAAENCQKIYDDLSRQSTRVDVLVNNAGAGTWGDFWRTDLDAEMRNMNLNMTSLVYLTKLFLKDMIKNRRGKILNVASTAAFQPGPLMAIYYATKAFVLSFSEAISNETRGTGVTVTALCPGPTATNFRDAAGMKKSMLFSKHLNLSAEVVARAGYEGMKRGKVIVVPGFKNRFIIQALRLAPRSFVRNAVRKMQEARRD